MQSTSRQRLCAGLVLGLALASLGCGKDEELPKVYPVKGKVVKNGKAVQGGQLQFTLRGSQEALLVKGRVGDDGSFTLTTHKGKVSLAGAPEGTYQVLYDPPAPPGAANDPVKAHNVAPILFARTYKVESKDNEFTLDIAKAKK